MEQKLLSGHRIEKIEGKEEKELRKRFFHYSDGVIRIYPGGWIYMRSYEKYANHILNFEVGLLWVI